MHAWLTSITVAILLCLPAGSHESQQSAPFPSIAGWSVTIGDKVYTPGDLWDFIDGAADLFLSYGFADLTLAEYRNPAGTSVRVELYRHNSTVNAFGIYSQERSPDYDFIDVGTQGYLEDGVLNFVCGQFYVKMTTPQAGTVGRDALRLIAGRIAEHTKQGKGWPPVLGLFPSEGKRVNSETYVAGDYLGYAFFHSVFVAEYAADSSFHMFIMELDSPIQAVATVNAYLQSVSQSTTKRANGTILVNDRHNGIVRLHWRGRYVCGLLNCPNGVTAEHYLGLLEAKLRDRQH